jgi:hypothetical protein
MSRSFVNAAKSGMQLRHAPVIPAQAGIQVRCAERSRTWVPAFAGTTRRLAVIRGQAGIQCRAGVVQDGGVA